jgi:uncharacterized iron-regulated membrane protein
MPQTLRARRVFVQVHLWVGLALGAYLVLLSVTGSAIVLRPEIHRWMIPRSVPMEGTRLTGVELEEALRRAYPDDEVTEIYPGRRPQSPVTVILAREGISTERLFDPYAARDLGLAYPPIVNAVEWVTDLHDNLLAGTTGRTVNGIGAGLFIALLVSGAILWWPGKARWRQALVPGRPEKSRRFARRLHMSLGVWALALLLVWAVTGFYFAFPDPFEATIDFFDDDLTDGERGLGEAILQIVVKLHFGRFGGLTGRLTWVALGLLPTILFVTGFIMWWTRVVRGRLRAPAAQPSAVAAAAAVTAQQ